MGRRARQDWRVQPVHTRVGGDHITGHRRVAPGPAHGTDAMHAAELMERRYGAISTVFCTQYL